MSNIVIFKPISEICAAENVNSFIHLCRTQLTVFGKELDFDSFTWDLSAHINIKGRNGELRAIFSDWKSSATQRPIPINEPFQSFAKSYFRYQHGLRPTKCIGPRLAALRALNEALQERVNPSIENANGEVFNRAAQLIAERFSSKVAYRTASQLKLIASFIDENHLCSALLDWSNSIRRPLELNNRVGQEFDRRRAEKLPSAYALDALARAFRFAEEPRDLAGTSIAAILCASPDRINEVLNLTVDCFFEEDHPQQGLVRGLRYWGSKDVGPEIKWIVPSMVDVVTTALGRLTSISKEARKIARWYEDHPGSMYLPPELEHRRGHEMDMASLAEVLYESASKGTAQAWCKIHHVPLQRRNGRYYVNFSDVEAAVLALLPRGFPIMEPESGTQYSEALCLIRGNEMHATRATLRGVIKKIDYGFVADVLGNNCAHEKDSVFSRLGFFEADGSPISIRTHQFRHYLNTLAQRGGLSELDIAKWSSRKDVGQNSAYNHVPDSYRQKRIAQLRGESEETFGQLVQQARSNIFPRERFVSLGVQAAHTTDLGFCVHDFAMSPCQLHLDCTNCNEQVCVKGDARGEENARKLQMETLILLHEARSADSDGLFGASIWAEHQERTAARVGELINILDNPEVPEGSLIRLTYTKPASRIEQAIANRAEIGVDEHSKLSWQVDYSPDFQ